MNLQNRVPLWIAGCIVLMIFAAVYVATQATIVPKRIVRSAVVPFTSKATTPSSVAEEMGNSDCPVFDSLEDAASEPKNVCYLVLGGQGLVEVPSAVERMTNLEFLFLQDNHLTALPHWIGILKKLSVIDADNNDLVSLPPEIGDLTNLTSLSVSNNQLSVLPPEITKLANLESLNLARNQLTTLPPLAQLKDLRDLSVSFNFLKALPEDISGLGELKYLYLSNNQITHIPPLNRLPLEGLNLAGNQVCGSDQQVEGADRTNLPSTSSIAATVCVLIPAGQG